jgi:hypothetical protein
MDKEMQWHLMRQAHREFGETMGQATINVPHRVEDEETRSWTYGRIRPAWAMLISGEIPTVGG